MLTIPVTVCGRTVNIDPELIARYRKALTMAPQEKIEDELSRLLSDTPDWDDTLGPMPDWYAEGFNPAIPGFKEMSQEDADEAVHGYLKDAIEQAEQPIDKAAYTRSLERRQAERYRS